MRIHVRAVNLALAPRARDLRRRRPRGAVLGMADGTSPA